ncbi:MAG: cytochrome c biogenesis protein CcsA [Campylobacteraceae bacterium]|jgi:cytochrome c-type biogenesis protein CcsB|nr:cytochrome c biogenesis protein CcsA [Campylobacteraceae bacterium]
MNLITKYLFSMPTMAILLIIFAFSCAVATFIENDFGTQTAWAVVYASWWFEFIQVLLGANLLYNILLFKLYKKEKLGAFLFHLSLLFILIGAGLTRYLGYEGTIHIRENESENIVKSNDPYIQIKAFKDGVIYGVDYKKFISKIGKNDFEFSFDVKDKKTKVEFKEYVTNAVSAIKDDPNGEPLIALAISNNDKAEEVVLKEGDIVELENTVFSFNKKEENSEKAYVRLILQNGEFFVLSNEDIDWFKMGDNTKGVYEKEVKQSFDDKHLYTVNNINFAATYIGTKGKKKIVSAEGETRYKDALIVSVTYNDITQEAVLFGMGRGYKGTSASLLIDNAAFMLEWGIKEFKLPFSITLNDFQLERYPGSNSPSSYASEITLTDDEANVQMPYKIYMNHVLDYKGYRFFQASYDQDEGGSVLSVNKDPGKLPTYIGYFLLTLGLLINILNPKSRFRKLSSQINLAREDKKSIKTVSILLCTLAVLSLTPSLKAQSDMDISAHMEPKDPFSNENDTIDKYTLTPQAKEHAKLFGTVLAQSMDGRIYPMDTVSHEILNKVYRKTSYKGMNANEILFNIINNPKAWQNEPIIRISHPELKKLLNVNGSYAAFKDFFDAQTNEYKLQKIMETAERKKESERNQFDKDVIKVDERINILFLTFTMDLFKIVPKVDDKNYQWHSVNSALYTFPEDEASNIRVLFGVYFESVDAAAKNGNWTNADIMIETIKKYQQVYSGSIIPTQTKIKAEIFFNEAKIFERIYAIYLLSGFILLIFIFVKMASTKFNIRPVIKTLFAVSLLAFVIHTAGLALRWYIAEHAPWSNSYESMIYIAWAIALSGLFFARTSAISMSLAYIMAGVTLFTAHLSWLDPQITNLMPVLKSHWLTIHVSVITASYGFLGLCALLGCFVLILKIMQGLSNNTEIEKNITEATKINEMSMILGLSLLTIGNFLGGVWANESWGRYWGWDPKETWALISILIYAAIVHFRFIPRLNNQFAFAVASMLAYFSIIMTYFGVNFYLSGMHSYASGDSVPVPTFIWVIIAVIAIITIFAAIVVKKDKKIGKEVKKL